MMTEFPTSSFQYHELIPRIADRVKAAHTRDSEKSLLEITKAILVLVILLSPSVGWSQTQIADQSSTIENAQQNPPPPPNSTPATPSAGGTVVATDQPPSPQDSQDDSKSKQTAPAPPPASGTVGVPEQTPSPQESQDDSKGKQTPRMLWVVPNFGAVSANTQLPPMSTREKFVLAARDSVVDYSSYTWAGILAGQAMLLNSDPELGHGAAGYGRYYWRTFTDGVSGTFFTEAIVPWIAHEDPRYYTMGEGGFFHRTGYAISRTFVTKTDSGHTRFNFSEVVGNGLEAGLSNAYYPPQERGLNQTATNWGVQMESAVLNHIFQEFWPDIRRKVFRQK